MAVGTPQMTVDLGGLTQWITSIGAHGLKQLATSGVHTHTLSCMLMIAELTPASNEFRRTISRERQQQRNERRWYFTGVEVGGATDFLADQLLKTRAGENVVALLAAIASTLDVASCTMILSSLFDVAGVSLDNTPGLGEFDKVREALLPLVRRTGFQEKVGQYHNLFQSLLDPKGLTKIDPYEAIPHEKDMPTIICMLSNLARNSNQILNYHGITGAGWVAAYASHIVGIKTCVIDSFGKTLPINSALEDSKVVIWISFSKPNTRCELSIAGNIEQFIVLESASELERTGWSIDCTKLCYLDENVPGLKETLEFLYISEFVAVEAMNILFSLINHTAEEDLRTHLELERRPYDYYMVAFKALYVRVFDILKILGFSCPPVTSFFVESGQDELSGPPRLVNKAEQGAFFLDYLLKKTGQFNGKTSLQKLSSYVIGKCGRGGLQNQLFLTGWSDEAQKNISMTVEYAAHIAAHLSFTDWPTSLKLLTVGHFYRRKSLTLEPLSIERHSLGSSGSSDSSLTVKNLLHHLIPICTDSFSAQHLKETYAGVEWAGLDIDGVIVLRAAALHDSLIDFKGQPLTLYSGRMMHEATRISMIKISLDGGSKRFIDIPIDKKEDMMERAVYRIPENNRTENTWELLNKDRFKTAESHEIHQTITRRMDILTLQHGYLYPGAIRIPSNPGGFSLLVPRVYVARSCNHNVETPLWLHSRRPLSEGINLFPDTEPTFFSHDINCDPLEAEWKAEWKAEWVPALFLDPQKLVGNNGIIVLQVQTCLHCIVHQITMLVKKRSSISSTFYIVHISQSASMRHSVSAPSTPANFDACRDFNAIQYTNFDPERHQDLGCSASVHTSCCADGLVKPILRTPLGPDLSKKDRSTMYCLCSANLSTNEKALSRMSENIRKRSSGRSLYWCRYARRIRIGL